MQGIGGPAQAAPKSLTALPKQLFIPLAEGPLRTVPVCTGLPSPFTQGESVQHCPWLQASHEQHKSFTPVGAGKMGGCRGAAVCWPPRSRQYQLPGRLCPWCQLCGLAGRQQARQVVSQHGEGMRGTHLPGLPTRNHSPRAATASFRTSLFLSSRGLASARITLAL